LVNGSLAQLVLNPGADGQSGPELVNRSTVSVTAFVLAWETSIGAPGTMAQDSLMNGGAAVAPGAAFRPLLVPRSAELRAALFADGTSQGEAYWIDFLRRQRNQAKADIPQALAVLRANPPDLVGVFDRWPSRRMIPGRAQAAVGAANTSPAMVSPVAAHVRQDLKLRTAPERIIEELESWAARLDSAL
jgi:hypothetical protein